MPEIALVVLAILAVGMIGLLTSAVTPDVMTGIGLWTLALGLAAGLPTGLWYHVVLYRTLAKKMVLPAKWWVSPGDLHVNLAGEELARVRPWFLIGGIGFALSVAGGIAAIAGLLLRS